MNIVAHIENLQRKKEVLENLIHLETTRPLPDFVRITQMKKQKLKLKEAMSEYSTNPVAA